MRAYFLGNMYLSSIQQGIQAAHATADMFVKYNRHSGECYDILHDWAANHKTMILLNAGYGEEIHDLIEFFIHRDNSYPWAEFYEGEDALDGALTTIGIVLPARIYETVAAIKKGDAQRALLNTPAHDNINPDIPADFNDWELEMIDRLPKYRMAR